MIILLRKPLHSFAHLQTPPPIFPTHACCNAQTISDNMSENMSDNISDNMSDNMSDNISDSMSDNMSDSMQLTHFLIHGRKGWLTLESVKIHDQFGTFALIPLKK